MNINSSSKCWGYSRRMKNWRKHRSDDYDIYELISQSAQNTSRTLTDQEVTDLGLEADLGLEVATKNKPYPEIKPRIKPLSKPTPKTKPIPIDSSTSYS